MTAHDWKPGELAYVARLEGERIEIEVTRVEKVRKDGLVLYDRPKGLGFRCNKIKPSEVEPTEHAAIVALAKRLRALSVSHWNQSENYREAADAVERQSKAASNGV